MPRGRRSTPTSLKELAGNPGKRKLNKEEPRPESGPPDCPDFLGREERREWSIIVPQLSAMGMLFKIDRMALAGYCVACAELAETTRILRREGLVQDLFQVTESGQSVLVSSKAHPATVIRHKALHAMRQFEQLFGLDPSSRSRLHTTNPVKSEGDQLDDFMNQPAGATTSLQ